MFSALKPVLEQLSTNVKKAPGWVPLSVLCYAAFHLLSQNLDGIGLSTATTAKVKAALAEHKELLVVAATFLLYILGDAIDKYLWKRLEPSGVNAARSKAEEALGVKQGLYRVSKALAEVAEKYDGSWIQVKNESAKMFRSLIIPSAVAGIVLIVKDQLAWGVAGLLGVGLFLLTYIHLKAAHICDLYRLAADTLTKNKEDYVTHDLQGRVRLFLWKGQLASSAELPSVLPFGFGPAEPGEAIVYGAQRPGAGSDDRVAWPTINEWITFVRQKGIRRVCCLLTARQLASTMSISSKHIVRRLGHRTCVMLQSKTTTCVITELSLRRSCLFSKSLVKAACPLSSIALEALAEPAKSWQRG